MAKSLEVHNGLDFSGKRYNKKETESPEPQVRRQLRVATNILRTESFRKLLHGTLSSASFLPNSISKLESTEKVLQ